MPNIEVKDVVRIVGDDKLWRVEYIIGERCALKQVDGECYRTANIGLLILVEKKTKDGVWICEDDEREGKHEKQKKEGCSMNSIKTKDYNRLEKEFPGEAIYFFAVDGKLNRFGQMAEELIELRKKVKN
ncbi:hypothetical protein KKC83_03305 [Patescibacteria group bacterium]|nr:hypothetical protein [Patescibacteria group bacterium]MBU4026541.1 hypothetical protein [Patescibacteria group bacterium]MBU4125473.1 hypothetical protein [Patescibacteria group bacterium]